MSTLFANMVMTSKVYDMEVTEAGRNLEPGKYILLAVPVGSFECEEPECPYFGKPRQRSCQCANGDEA